ncbi:MAG: prolyl-tRNA synthetase associated domain-containing protein [Candidatus Cryptobacteroides sp.]
MKQIIMDGPGIESYLQDPEIAARIQKVLDFLEDNGIDYEIYRHPPLPTIEIALEYWKNLSAVHCKNLFMRNHKGNRHYLISFECHKNLDIHTLEHMLRQGKLSFASEERMVRCLGLHPGSVSPFGLINDMGLAVPSPDSTDSLPVFDEVRQDVSRKELFPNGHRVKFFIDSDIRNADRVSFHPCDNTASVIVSYSGFIKFLNLWGGEYEWIDIFA